VRQERQVLGSLPRLFLIARALVLAHRFRLGIANDVAHQLQLGDGQGLVFGLGQLEDGPPEQVVLAHHRRHVEPQPQAFPAVDAGARPTGCRAVADRVARGCDGIDQRVDEHGHAVHQLARAHVRGAHLLTNPLVPALEQLSAAGDQ
jgi:hypothetical protein